MPTLHYEYEDPENEVVVSPRPKARPVGWRAWWEGSPYANPVGGIIDRFMDGVQNLKLSEGPKQQQFSIKVTQDAFEVSLPDGTTTVYPLKDITDIVINFNPENTVWDRENRTNLSFFYQDQKHHFYLIPYRVAILATIEVLLENRIPYREYVHQSRTFRLRGNMMYKDIQMLKEKYGIVW